MRSMLGKKSIMLICILLTASQACLAAGKQPSKQHFDSRGSAELNENETAHLVFMREEEKLARDVYTTLGLAFPKLKIFGKIDDAEQRHTCAVCDMLKKYGVEDPSTNDNVGVYTGKLFGDYFTARYAALVDRGSVSALDALYVGAYIEEMDMLDINYCPKEIIDRVASIKSDADCGKVYTDNRDIQRLYESLLEGSENHLRAFVVNIERRLGEGSYQAQVLEPDQLEDILDR